MPPATNGAQDVGDRGVPHSPDLPERRLALTFDAFDAHHHTLWLRYAHTQVGGRAAAETVVDTTCARLLEHWPHVLAQESVARYAWAVLKEEVARWLYEHDLQPVLVDTAAFHAAIRKLLLYETRDQFAVLQGEVGLYAAISRLPERQYDVIVLRYVLHVPDEDVAEYMGIEVATVRSHVRHARRRLAKDLDVRDTETGE
ncbi:sigma factor-like helix-turn-helix DNA-binding protein [Streptomyces sp. NPDC088400]|uniref:sigma factor-like helix-turn-helix DNA-binding protein n=1 Tax=Streptomyces sp. NPDC088400 TaxID=3365861 RepID=UPI003807B0EE